jgi:hypothetical protein
MKSGRLDKGSSDRGKRGRGKRIRNGMEIAFAGIRKGLDWGLGCESRGESEGSETGKTIGPTILSTIDVGGQDEDDAHSWLGSPEEQENEWQEMYRCRASFGNYSCHLSANPSLEWNESRS